MITWIALKLGLSQIVVKFILFAAVSGVILFSLRLWGNKQWYKGEVAGRQFVASQLEKQKKAEWEAKEKAIASAAANINTEKKVLQADRERLQQERANISRSLNNALATVAKEKVRNYENVSAIPNSELDSAIRATSAELSAAH